MPNPRLAALDLMRGVVMVLMALDHSSDAFNAGRLFTDSTSFYQPGTPLPAAQFLLRWITHLCAPTFLFLAGAGLWFNVQKQRKQGRSEAGIDAYLLTRGLLIAAFELWVSYFVMPKGKVLFQVLYAIGTSYLLMIPLRRLSSRPALVVALGLMLSLELDGDLLRSAFAAHTPLWATLLFLPGNPKSLVVAYPTLHWTALMLFGWALGSLTSQNPNTPREPSRKLLILGSCFLAAFLAIRGCNGYGNMGLYRENNSLVQWLHVSKYPPGLSYISLELGLCFVCLGGLFRWSERHAPGPNNLFIVLGQTPLFFYLLHFPLLMLSARALGVEGHLGIGAAVLGAASVVTVLYPVCRAYRRYKAAHPRALTRFV